MSWKFVDVSRQRRKFRGSLVPSHVTVISRYPKDGTGFASKIEAQFSVGMPGAEDRIELVHLEVYGLVTTELLESISPESWGEEVYSEWLGNDAFQVQKRQVVFEAPVGSLRAGLVEAGKSVELEEVAWVYLQAPTRGTQNVLEALGYGSKATAIRRVAEARQAGLIPPAGAPKKDYEKALEKVRKERSSNA